MTAVFVARRVRLAPRSRSGRVREPNGDPWESRKANWAHLGVRSGRLTGCAFGEARDAPKPNERVDHKETKTAARLLGAPGPEGLKVVAA